MQNPRENEENDFDDADDNNNDLAGNASGNDPDGDYIELDSSDAESGTGEDDEDGAGTAGPLSDYEGLDDDEDFPEDDE
jgi:hypothetical protein